MLIEEKTLNYWIDNFYGYGSWNARIWFVGYEEGGGDLPEEVADKINYFYRVHNSGAPQLCEIRDLYRQVAFNIQGPKSGLFTNLYEYRFDSNAILHGTWKNLIAFVHGYRGKKLPDLTDYQKNLFALSSMNSEALIRLYPLPSPHNHAWYYSWLDMPQMPFLKSRSQYEAHVYHTRIQRILENMSTSKPEAVLMYGMNNINTLKQTIQEFFPGVKFKMIKAIKQKIPQHHLAEINGTILLITTQIPALRHNRIESGFDWEEVGKMVRSGSPL
jgi:hypothetical protein